MDRRFSRRVKYVGLKPCLLAATLLLWAAPASSLPVTYQDTGRLFTEFVTPYDGTMSVDGSITFPTPLPASSTLQSFAIGFETNGGSYSFSDGTMTYDLTNSTPADLLFATDKSGNITAWQVEIFSDAGPILLLQSLPSIPGSGFDKVLSSGAQQLALSDGPATWTDPQVVPEPAVFTLSVLGLSALAAAKRRIRT